MKAPEKEHVKKVGEEVFSRAEALAMFAIRQDGHLVGLDKIRNAMAEEAALRATGYQKRAFVPPKGCGEPTQDIMDLCEATIEVAAESARARL
jgi:hypothetical protein